MKRCEEGKKDPWRGASRKREEEDESMSIEEERLGSSRQMMSVCMQSQATCSLSLLRVKE